jgi:Tfp pilus assembly protein PilP
MNRYAIAGLLACAMGLSLPAHLGAQAPAAGGKDDTIKAILDQELEPAPGGYTYNPQGRRDPFVSLIKPVTGDAGPKIRKPGMEGFLIQEVALKGILKTSGGGEGVAEKPGYIAIFQGPDGNKSYFVNVGQRLFDGQLTAIDSTSVTFHQEVTDPLSPVKTREIRQSLYPSEEARQ